MTTLASLAFISLVSLASKTPVSVIGEAPLGKDRRLAEAAAMKDARRQALERGAGVAVQAMTVVRNYALIADVVSTQSTGVLVDESWGSPSVTGGTVRIALRAGVETGDLGEHACRVLRAQGEPVIAVVAANKHGRDDDAEVAITNQLIGGCMRAVYVEAANAEAALDQSTLAKAKELGADYAVIATTGRANGAGIAARVVDTTSNEVLALETGSSPAGIADALFKELATRWTGEAVGGTKVEVKLSGLSLADAKRASAEIAGVLHATPPEQVTLRDGVARFTIIAPNGGRAAAPLLDGKTFAGNKLSVVSVTQTMLELDASQSL